jgi:hypothetical protein
VDARKKPNEEQLAHVLESTLTEEPEKNEAVFILSLVCLKIYTFMLTTIPNKFDVILARTNPTIASSGK